MKCKNAEEFVYESVLNGDLEIMLDGTVWRVRKRGWDRWKQQAVSRPCRRVRAEHDIGDFLNVRSMFDGVRANALAHRLIYRHFKGPIADGIEIFHRDGSKKHNHPDNLASGTHSEVQLHSVHELRTSRMAHQYGSDNAMAKLTLPEVEEIFQRRTEGERLVPLAREFGVSYQAVSKIALGDRWAKYRAASTTS
jgi:hypothetical protein